MPVAEDRIADFVARKLGIRSCEACGMTLWRSDPTLYELRPFDGPGARVPLIRLSCGKCGNTKLFDAIAAGLTDPDGRPLP